MTNKIKVLIILLIAISFNSLAQEQKSDKNPFYDLSVTFNPDSNFIAGSLGITNPSDSVFVLSKSLKIKSISAKGKSIPFEAKNSDKKLYSCEYSLKKLSEKVLIQYEGKIKPDDYPKTISNLNMISSELIELSNQIDWYPGFLNSSSFNYQVTINLPENFRSVTTGLMEKEKQKVKRTISTWKSEKPVHGITLVAAPGLKKSILQQNEYTIEIYFSKLPVSYIDSMKNDLMKSLLILTEMNGSKGAADQFKVIYSPRSAGAYARAPLLIVSEEFALEMRNHKFGYARDFRLNTHEMAHYWSKSRTDSPDDWINEGLAEYLALFTSEKVIGKEFNDLLLKEYNNIVYSSPTELSILETKSDSRDREINRYYKPTLLLNEIKQKYGNDSLKVFLNSLDKAFVENKRGTTQLFLQTLEKEFGKPEKDKFGKALNKNSWVKASELSKSENLVVDSIYLGTWEGNLKQFGTATRFVFNLTMVDGTLYPNIDSPDQNVYGIPVSDFYINEAGLGFSLGAASATFTAKFDNEKKKIIATWAQRGIDYPLELIKK